MVRQGAASMNMTPKQVNRKPLRVSVVLTEAEYSRLGELATNTERSMSWLGRYAIRKLLEENQVRQLPLRLEGDDEL